MSCYFSVYIISDSPVLDVKRGDRRKPTPKQLKHMLSLCAGDPVRLVGSSEEASVIYVDKFSQQLTVMMSDDQQQTIPACLIEINISKYTCVISPQEFET